MTAPRTEPMPTGIACGVGFVGAIVGTIIAVACRSTHDPILALIPLGAVTAATSAATTWIGGLAAAWMCWLLDSGFVVGRTAQLTFGPSAGAAALVLVIVAVMAGSAGRLYRRRRQRVSTGRLL
ncbi:hypothetical protein SAMN04515671_1002 [Nakamurella panacisegetis]|uniref:Uncharacterized protein n=1 Tax=Nakamurella panacisegetis TaxID=1090615 RepID=A0A1H0JR12_9ACTN|nr:hypothetical protein [Nakamurella panacisegetis]SDO45980.1 hypothetical protein SAMN04515671_1002 [Nakamurella panacisegetis]